MDECVFCFECLSEKPCTPLACKHTFHTDCLLKWELASRKKQCVRCFKHYGFCEAEQKLDIDNIISLFHMLFAIISFCLSLYTCDNMYINIFIDYCNMLIQMLFLGLPAPKIRHIKTICYV